MRTAVTILVLVGIAFGIYGVWASRQSSSDVLSSQVEMEESPDSRPPSGAQNHDLPKEDSTDEIETQQGPRFANVAWRRRAAGVLHPVDYTSGNYEYLRSLAESGDAQAASWLAKLLYECSFSGPPLSENEIETKTQEMRNTHRVPIVDNGVETIMDFNNSLDSLEGEIERFESQALRCRSVPEENRQESDYWATQALAMGETDILVSGVLANAMAKDDYERLVTDLWNAGEPMALFELSTFHHRSSWEDHDTSGQVLGYAYDKAILILTTDYYENHGLGLDRERLSGFEADLASQRSRMRPHEIQEAERMAEDIVENNGNCCVSWPDYMLDP